MKYIVYFYIFKMKLFRTLKKVDVFKILYFCGAGICLPYIVTKTFELNEHKKFYLFFYTYIGSVILWPVAVPLIYTDNMQKIVERFN